MSITAFLRVRVINEVRFFNEDLGQGATTRYQSGEDSDYFIRALKLGFRIWYEPSFTVYHPELQSIERLKTTSYSYALGVGYVLRLHKYSWWYLAKLLMRSFGAALLWLCKGKVSKCHLCVLRGMGQFAGYLSGL